MRLRFTTRATTDVDAIYKHVSGRNPVAALAVARKNDGAIQELLQHPRRGRSGRVLGTCELVGPGLPYLVAYAVTEETIDILAVLHGARAWPGAFEV